MAKEEEEEGESITIKTPLNALIVPPQVSIVITHCNSINASIYIII